MRRATSGRVFVIFTLLLVFPRVGAVADPADIESAPDRTPADRVAETHPPPEVETTLAELRDKRQQAQAELNSVRRPELPATGASRDVTQAELQERRTLREQIVRGYDEQIHDYLRLQEARQRHADIERLSAEWNGLEEPPPYSIVMTDQLWNAAYSFRLVAAGLESQRDLLVLRFDRARESLAAAEERVRQSSEKVEAVEDPSQAARLRSSLEMDNLRKRAAAVILSAAELSKKRVEEELAETQARFAFAERQLHTAESSVEFTENDLKKTRGRLSQERQSYEQELERTLAERRAHAQAVQKAERHLQSRLARQKTRGTQAKESPPLARANADVELARADMDTLVLTGDLLRQMIEVVEGERRLWESRYTIWRSEEPGRAREAWQRFEPLSSNLRASRDYLRQQAGIVSGQISELDARLANAEDLQRDRVQALLRIHRQREHEYNRALQRVDQAIRLFARWKSETTERFEELPLSARIEDWLNRAWHLIKSTWTVEVFVAEDTIEVDGKKITGYRSVTMGKIASALLILVVGYVMCRYLARIIGRLAVTRFGLAPDVANIVRQWSQALLVMLLIIVSLMSVKIPLTVFAFLGGAFAIGVGFGAQNLIKNVISGILVLIERPLRVGDLIEVENIRGRVTSIGLRSSTVRDPRGMETLIPNSSFLERYLTNWTYSSSASRFSLRVGAAYGSSSQQVMDILADLARQHPFVLKSPEPQVLLDEFGSQARIFTLNYWLAIRPEVDPNQVASELRFAIEQKFSESGLKVMPAT